MNERHPVVDCDHQYFKNQVVEHMASGQEFDIINLNFARHKTYFENLEDKDWKFRLAHPLASRKAHFRKVNDGHT